MNILAILKMLYEIINTVKGILNFIEQNKNEEWFKDSQKVFNDFKQKTPEERLALARGISDLIKRM